MKKGDGTRITVHFLDPKKEEFIQCVPYHPDMTGEERVTSIRSGLVGKCYREGRDELSISHVDQDRSLCEQLVSDWSYSKEEASRKTQDRKVYGCIPLVTERDEIIGVIFMDSADEDAFEDKDHIGKILATGRKLLLRLLLEG